MTSTASARTAPKRSRVEWVEIVSSYPRGMTANAIALDLGVSASFIRDLRTDPDGSRLRQRKQGYSGRCEQCGAFTDGSNGRTNAPRLCRLCAPAAYATRTHEALIAAIRAWAERFGRPPTAMEWNPSQVKSYARRYPGPTADRLLATAKIVLDEDWPRSQTVVWRFGSFATALRAAGFEPRPPGRPKGVASA